MIYHRENARFSYPVELTANFFVGGQYVDPALIDRVEIWRGGEGAANGGTLVDVVSGNSVIRNDIGRYKIIWDPYLEGSSPLTSPGVQGPGSPNQGASPNDPVKIVPQEQYYDIWYLKISVSDPSFISVGFGFFLYQDNFFADTDTSKFRFEMKPDRKKVIKGEKLDIRLSIVPVPLYSARRDLSVQSILPMCKMNVRITDINNLELFPWFEIRFTGREGILLTENVSSLQFGDYCLFVDLILPNGKSIKYPKYMISVED
jgi:hypothetical protein